MLHQLFTLRDFVPYTTMRKQSQTNAAYHAALHSNSLKPCNTRGCQVPRLGLEAVCKGHLQNHKRYGDGNMKAIHRRHWKADREQVAALFAANLQHPGLLQAVRWVDGFIQQAVANESSYFGASEMARLHRSGCVTGLDVVTEVCAVGKFIRENPHLVKEDRAADFVLSRAIIQLQPRPRIVQRSSKTGVQYSSPLRIKGSALGYLGKTLRLALAPLMANVAMNAKGPSERRKEVEAAMRLPFGAPVA